MSDNAIYGYFVDQFHAHVPTDPDKAATALYNLALVFSAEAQRTDAVLISDAKQAVGGEKPAYEEAFKRFEMKFQMAA